MTTNLTVYPLGDLTPTVRALNRQLEAIDRQTTLAVLASHQLADLVDYAATKAALTVRQGDRMVQVARQLGLMTPGKQTTVEQLTRDYLNHVILVVDQSGQQMVARLNQLQLK